MTLRRLIDFGTHPAQLMAMVSRQFRLLIQVKELSQLRHSTVEVAAALSLQNWQVDRLARQAQMFSMPELERLYQRMVRTDSEVKVGRTDGQLALELLTAEVCQRAARPTS
jgi:DNA polymerase III subunit delta